MKQSASIVVGASVMALGVVLLGTGFGISAFAAEPAKPAMDMPAMDPARSAKGFVITPVMKGSTTASGQTVAYPSGKPEVTAVFATIEPGGQTAAHQHPVQEYVQVLEGTVIVQADGGKAREYGPGQGWLEDVALTHQAWNKGKTPVKLLVVFMGEQGKDIMVQMK
jgi:quercetin dioxygenase-like cupin family protein